MPPRRRPVQSPSAPVPRTAATASALQDLGPIARFGTLTERVYGHLRELLIAGRLAPGERLSLRGVAKALGVSIMPVREAVSRLVADRALEVAPNRAVRVPVMSAARFRELALLRAEIEGFAAERAATARDGAALRAIAAAESAFSAEARKPDPDAARAVALNRDLHFAIYAAAGMPLLEETIAGLWLKAGPVLNLDMRANPERLRASPAARLHATALAAIRAGDGPAARAAIAADIAAAAEFILARGALAPG